MGLLGVSIARIRPGAAHSRSAATLAAVLVRRSWWRAALGGALAWLHRASDEGVGEGEEPSPGALERRQAAGRPVRPGRTTSAIALDAQPTRGRLKVGIPINGVNLGSLEPTPASTGSEPHSQTRNSHCEYGLEKACQGQRVQLPAAHRVSVQTSMPFERVGGGGRWRAPGDPRDG